MSKPFSGHECIRLLCSRFGFVVISQRGSHVKLRRTDHEKTWTTVVPIHKELAEGTLRSILRLADIDVITFTVQREKRRNTS